MVSLNVFANHNIRGFTILPFTARRLSHCHHRCENPVSITPLFATHTSCSQLAENITALSSLLATHTDFTPVSPVFVTHTKTAGVYTNSSHFGISQLSSVRIVVLSFHALTNAPSRKFFLLTSLQMPGGVGAPHVFFPFNLQLSTVNCQPFPRVTGHGSRATSYNSPLTTEEGTRHGHC